MLVLYRDNGVLYARCFLKLKKDIEYKNHIFGKNKEGFEDFIEVDSVMKILTVNGDITIFNGDKFVKMGLVEFSDCVLNNKYLVEELEKEEKVVEIPVIIEPTKEVQQPKVEPKKEVKPPVQQPKVEPKKEEEVVEESNNENKKKRHKNQVQGDDK